MEDVQWYDRNELAAAVALFDELAIGCTVPGTWPALPAQDVESALLTQLRKQCHMQAFGQRVCKNTLQVI
jgi:hypothetical protein